LVTIREVASSLRTKLAGQGAWIERRYSHEQSIRASAAIGAGATVNTTFEAQSRKVVLLFIDVSAFAGTSLTANIQLQDPVTAAWVTIKAQAISSVALRIFAIGLGFTQADAAPLFYVNWPAPSNLRIRVNMVHVGVTGATYSIGSIELENG